MGAEALQTFSSIATALRAEFISYRELMTKLATFTGDSLSDVASVLKIHKIYEVHTARLVGAERRVEEYACAAKLESLLNHTAEHGTIKEMEGNTQNNDVDCYGWIRGRLTLFLEIERLPNPETLALPDATEASPNTEKSISSSDSIQKLSGDDASVGWHGSFVGKQWIRLGDAATILAGFSPLSAYRWGADERDLINQSRNLLRKAITLKKANYSIRTSEQLSPEQFSVPFFSGSRPWHLDVGDDLKLVSQADIRVWCKRYKRTWPIPESALEQIEPSGSTDPMAVHDNPLLVRLTKAESECSNLRTLNEAASEEVRKLSDQVANLTRQLGKMEEERHRLAALVPPLPNYLIPLVVAVQHKFWLNWEEGKPRPKARTISSWLRGEFPQLVTSDAIANAIDKVACPVSRDLSTKK